MEIQPTPPGGFIDLLKNLGAIIRLWRDYNKTLAKMVKVIPPLSKLEMRKIANGIKNEMEGQ